MAAFLTDDFTDTDATTLTAHAGQIGATWTLPGSENTAVSRIYTSGVATSRLSANTTASSAVGHYLSSGVAAADHWVRATMLVLSIPIDGGPGITLRTDATCANCYLVQYMNSTASWQLFKKVAGTFTQLGSNVAQTLTINTYYELYFSVVGSQIDFTVDGVSKFSTTNGDVTAAGKVGLRIGRPTAGGSASTGLHFDQIVGDAGTQIALRSVGDSTTQGYKASPQATKRWPHLVAVALGWNDYTRALASTQIIDQCSVDRVPANNQVYLPFAPATSDRWRSLTGYNDMRYFGTDANGLETYKRVLRSAVAWLSRAPASVYHMNNAAWTEVGSFSTAVVNGTITSRYTTTNGDKTTASISGTAITVAYLSRFGLGDSGTALEVRIDGNLVGTIDTTFGSASGYTNDGIGAARYVPMAMRYGGLSAGAHTVELKHNSTAGKIIQPLFVVGTGGAAGSEVRLADPFKVSNYNLGSPYNVGSDTAVANYSSAINDIVADAVADGYVLVTRAMTNNHFVVGTDEDADGIHPNNSGYQHIADAFMAGASRRPLIVSQAVNRASTY